MRQSRELRFDVNHPSAAGHFPGNPIIPGALLLDEVVRAIADGEAGDIAIRSVKFLLPVRPGDGVELQWERDADGETRFECRILEGGGLALVGSLRLMGQAS